MGLHERAQVDMVDDVGQGRSGGTRHLRQDLGRSDLTMTSTKQDSTEPDSPRSLFCECVEQALKTYFADLDGQDTSDLHQLVVSQVERPLFEIVLNHYSGNITRSAQALGLSRGTFLRRLKKYGIAR